MRTFLIFVLVAIVPASARLQLAWPTPNTAYVDGRPIEEYVQPTASGEPESGLFGGVRGGGNQFHEGLDLFPLKRDASGEAIDPVFAVMDGVVRHASLKSGESSYGRYIVIEHTGATPAFVSLYAHMRSIDVRAGDHVSRGQAIGVMGRSAAGYSIPKDRAHVHLEMALVMTTDFQRWYDRQKFGSPNHHRNYNGMNLMGVDPKEFFDEFRAKRVNDFGEYLALQPVAVRVRVGSRKIPDFAARYPSLVKTPVPVGEIAGWEIGMMWTGLPVFMRPLSATEAGNLRPGAVQVLSVDADLVAKQRSIRLVRMRGGKWTPSGDLDNVIGKLFGP
ncbi:MAG TPA: M23 family metallopeptidase [Opitutaceae bacterium]|nr:M23 family metallopeptidase [Opitutaceae bacterium]